MPDTITQATAGMVAARAAHATRAVPVPAHVARATATPMTREERATVALAWSVFHARERVESAMLNGATDDEILRCVYAFLMVRAAQEGRVTAS